MPLFTPSKDILEAITFDNESHKQYTTFPSDAPEPGLVSYLESVSLNIRQFYWIAYKRKYDEKNNGKILLAIWESMSNCRFHGCKPEGNFIHGIFLGKNGICNGFYDGGAYFGREDIKKQWEAKTPIKEFDLSYKDGCRVGANENIFPASDKIEVNTKERVLYTMHFLHF